MWIKVSKEEIKLYLLEETFSILCKRTSYFIVSDLGSSPEEIQLEPSLHAESYPCIGLRSVMDVGKNPNHYIPSCLAEPGLEPLELQQGRLR
ncbi:hypothetical protein J6590_000581 [Homalodisca vitripennis]|nr:hypothetical protein J6590_000581 [Homalodisca vitripennis]